VNSRLRRYDVELVLGQMREWEHRSTSSLSGDLAALMRDDPGAGSDLVIGLVSASPVVTSSLHQLGMAQVFGRHIVLRGMDDAAERDEMLRGYQMVSREKLEGIYRERLVHKQACVLIHEWGHTTGAVHGDESDDYMHPAYSTRIDGFSLDNLELLQAALSAEDRPASARALLAALEARSSRRKLTPDETTLADHLRTVSSTSVAAPVAPASAPAEEALAPLQIITADQSEKCRIRSMRRLKPMPAAAALTELQPVANRLNADSVLLEQKPDHLMATLLRCK
jgi:hypothetical protein